MLNRIFDLKQKDPSFFNLSIIKLCLWLGHFIVLFIPLYQILLTSETIESFNITNFAAFPMYIIVWLMMVAALLYFSVMNDQKVAKWMTYAYAGFATLILFMTLFYFFTDFQEAASFTGVDVRFSIGFILQCLFYLLIITSLFIKKDMVEPAKPTPTKPARPKQKKKRKRK